VAVAVEGEVPKHRETMSWLQFDAGAGLQTRVKPRLQWGPAGVGAVEGEGVEEEGVGEGEGEGGGFVAKGSGETKGKGGWTY
jgi:hypothetical protein